MPPAASARAMLRNMDDAVSALTRMAATAMPTMNSWLWNAERVRFMSTSTTLRRDLLRGGLPVARQFALRATPTQPGLPRFRTTYGRQAFPGYCILRFGGQSHGLTFDYG